MKTLPWILSTFVGLTVLMKRQQPVQSIFIAKEFNRSIPTSQMLGAGGRVINYCRANMI